MKRLLIIALAALSICSCAQEHKTAIVAHRGYWNCEDAVFTQNSVAALMCAQEQGFWASEFDIHLTADDTIFVFHDDILAGHIIHESIFDDIKYAQPLNNGENPPALKKFLEQAARCTTTKIVCEFKAIGVPEREDILIAKTIRELKDLGLYDPERVIFISFSRHICQEIARIAPEFTNQYLNGDATPAELHEEGINGIDYNYKVLDEHPEYVAEAHELGMSVNVWTVNRAEDIQRFIDLGVDQITTNEPLLARELLGDKELRSKRNDFVSAVEIKKVEEGRTPEYWMSQICAESFRGRKLGTPGCNAAKAYITSELEKMGYEVKEQPFRYKDSLDVANIYVEIPGKSEEIVALGAHYDGAVDSRWYQGADDNISGVVSVLKICSDYAEKNIQPENTLVLCFWTGEENTAGSSFNGSRYFTQNYEKIGDVKYYLNFDCYARKDMLTYFYYPSEFPKAGEIMGELLGKADLGDVQIVLNDKCKYNTDYAPFADINIPFGTFNDFTTLPFVHAVDDNIDHISFEQIYAAIDLAEKFIERL